MSKKSQILYFGTWSHELDHIVNNLIIKIEKHPELSSSALNSGLSQKITTKQKEQTLAPDNLCKKIFSPYPGRKIITDGYNEHFPNFFFELEMSGRIGRNHSLEHFFYTAKFMKLEYLLVATHVEHVWPGGDRSEEFQRATDFLCAIDFNTEKLKGVCLVGF